MAESKDPKLSIVIPAFNEEARLPKTLHEITNYLDKRTMSYEIIVVDDGSSDGTPRLVESINKTNEHVKLIRLPQNLGKGGAVRAGMLQALAPAVIFLDADGSTPIGELEKLEAALLQGFDIVIGSRAIRDEATAVRTRWYRKYLGRMFNFCVNILIVPGIADTQCGFKLFTRHAAQTLFSLQRSNGFSFDVEILFLARRLGLRIKEIPVNWNNVAGSKVNLLIDALKMFKDVLRFRSWHANVPRNKENQL